MLKLATEDPRKRYQAQQMQGIQAPRGVAPKETESTMQRFSKLALDKGMDTAIDKGGEMAMKYGKPLLDSTISAMTGVPSQAAIASQAASTSTAAPLMQQVMGGGAGTGLMAKAGAGLSGMGSSLGAMGTAAMASPLAPIVGGLAAMKLLGFFSNGGQVGPLSAAQYKDEGGQVEEEKDTGTKILEELEEQLRKKKAAKEDRSTLLPSFRSLGGDISKVEYKSAGGETYKLFYGGGPLSKGA